MSWRIAESLEVLRRQLNAAYPNRSKVSDGGIGDAAHASRSSDHNPWFKDKNGVGIVSARDFTHDPKGGLDCHRLAKVLVESRDPRIKYIIWNKQICSSEKAPWQWRAYGGVNAHKHHLHLSVKADPKLYDSTKPWDLDIAKVNQFADLKDEEIKLEIPAALISGEAQTQTIGRDAAESLTPQASPENATETTEKQTVQTPTTEVSTEVTTVNQQSVSEPAEVAEPLPYNGIGFWPTIKKDLAAATGGNLTFQALSEYAQQANNLPSWLVPMIGKLAFVILLASIAYFVFRVIHYAADTWKKQKKVELETNTKTDINRKDVVWK